MICHVGYVFVYLAMKCEELDLQHIGNMRYGIYKPFGIFKPLNIGMSCMAGLSLLPVMSCHFMYSQAFSKVCMLNSCLVYVALAVDIEEKQVLKFRLKVLACGSVWHQELLSRVG